MLSRTFRWTSDELIERLLDQARHNRLLTPQDYPSVIDLKPHWINILNHMRQISFAKKVEVARHLKTDLKQQKLLISPLIYGTKTSVTYQVQFISKNGAYKKLIQKHIGNIHTHLSYHPFSVFDLTKLITRPANLISFLVTINSVFLVIRTRHTPYYEGTQEECELHLKGLFASYFKNTHYKKLNESQLHLLNALICQKYNLVFYTCIPDFFQTGRRRIRLRRIIIKRKTIFDEARQKIKKLLNIKPPEKTS